MLLFCLNTYSYIYIQNKKTIHYGKYKKPASEKVCIMRYHNHYQYFSLFLGRT